MYNNGSGAIKAIASGATVVTGVAVLPATSGNNFGFILAISAITIGVVAIVGQIAVRTLRHYY